MKKNKKDKIKKEIPNYDGTMEDPILIGQYKDEIDLEIAQEYGLDVSEDAMIPSKVKKNEP